MRKMSARLALALLALLLVPAAASAIPITNAGFESFALENGRFSAFFCDPTNPSCLQAVDVIPGWTVRGSAGSHNVGPFGYPNEAPEGSNVAFVNATPNGSTVSQTLAAQVEATEYALTIDVGNPLRVEMPPIWSVEVWAGGSLLGAMDSQSATPGPADGTFSTMSLVFDVAPLAPQIGELLEIRLRTSVGSGQVGFDNLRLDDLALVVPEPGTMLLMGLGLAGLGSIRRRAPSAA